MPSASEASGGKAEPGDQIHCLGETHHVHSEPLERSGVDMEDSVETISNFRALPLNRDV